MGKQYRQAKINGPNKRARPIHMNFCLNQAEYDHIVESSRQAGVYYSHYVRAMVMRGQVIARLSDEDKLLFKEMVQFSNMLSQLVAIAREQGLEEGMLYFETFRGRVDILLNKINL